MIKSAKYAFADSLKMMLEKKSLDHITVKDIVEDCGVSRQAFYYYFNDIYDLVEWIFKKECEEVLADNRDIDNWQKGYLSMLKRLQNNKKLVINTYRSARHEYIVDFMHKVLFDAIYTVLEEEAEGMKVDKKDKEFIAYFYSLAVTGVNLDWVKSGMKEKPEDIVDRVAILVRGDFKRALEKYEKYEKKGTY